jgi:hypothetical protein
MMIATFLLFMVRQPLLTPNKAAEADRSAVAADRSMAGNDEGDRVFVVGIVRYKSGGSNKKSNPGVLSGGFHPFMLKRSGQKNGNKG